MKKTFLLVPLAIILVMSLFLVSCEDEPELKSYTVTFLLDEGDTEPFDKKTVIEGTGITDAKVPEKTGHKFLNWKTIEGNDAYELNTPVKGDITLVAVWEINKYTVSFLDGEEKAAEPQTVEYGKTATAPTAPTKEGHTFSCWKKVGSSSLFDFAKEVITEDTVLEAVWDINTYTVTFKNADGTDYATKDVLYNGKVDKPEGAPTPKEGYSFKHWATSADSKSGYDFATPITNNLVLYPVFEINEYTVTFIGNDHISSVPEPQIVAYGSYAKDPNAKAKDGYVLNGWKTEGSEEYFDFETKIMSDITLQAVVSRDTAKAHVSFYDGEKLVSSGYYKIGNIQDFPIYNIVGTECTLKWVLEGDPETEYLPAGGFTPVDYKTEYKFYAYITTDLLNIDESGAVKATDKLKDSTDEISLSIPYSLNGIAVTAIANYGFAGCSNLTEITIPETVTSMGTRVFSNCRKLQSAVINAKVDTLPDETFNSCDALKSISLSSTITEIKGVMLGNLQNLESITVSENSSYLKSVDGVLYSKDSTRLIHYPAKKEGEGYVILSTVTIIEGQAFRYCRNLKSVTIPDTVTEIRVQSFSGCSNLTSIRIPNKVTRIGSYVFDGCTNLTDIYVDKDESTTLFANASVPSGCNIHWNSTGPALVN